MWNGRNMKRFFWEGSGERKKGLDGLGYFGMMEILRQFFGLQKRIYINKRGDDEWEEGGF